jgi:hypothetical protein
MLACHHLLARAAFSISAHPPITNSHPSNDHQKADKLSGSQDEVEGNVALKKADAAHKTASS